MWAQALTWIRILKGNSQFLIGSYLLQGSHIAFLDRTHPKTIASEQSKVRQVKDGNMDKDHGRSSAKATTKLGAG